MATIAADQLALPRLYHWERTAGSAVTLTQPMGGADVKDFTWAQVGDQVRRMAALPEEPRAQAKAGRPMPRSPSCPRTAPGG